MNSFEEFPQQQFEVGTPDRHHFSVMGCDLSQSDDGSIKLTQRARLETIDDGLLTSTVSNKYRLPHRDATSSERHLYQSVIGQMLYVGRMAQPVMLYHASNKARKINGLKIHHPKDLPALPRSDKQHIPTLTFNKPTRPGRFSLEALSDASMSSIAEGDGRSV